MTTLMSRELKMVKGLQEWWNILGGISGATGEVVKRNKEGMEINVARAFKSRKMSTISNLAGNQLTILSLRCPSSAFSFFFLGVLCHKSWRCFKIWGTIKVIWLITRNIQACIITPGWRIEAKPARARMADKCYSLITGVQLKYKQGDTKLANIISSGTFVLRRIPSASPTWPPILRAFLLGF